MSRHTLLKNTITTAIFLIIATIIASIFFYFTRRNTTTIAIIYMLAVTFVAKYTVGYVPGIIASLVGVICVNYVFTFPFMELNFTIDGYPMTFIGMMVISSTTSTLTTHLKESRTGLSMNGKSCSWRRKRKPCGPIFCGRFPTICGHR